jgi:uncharacterized protein involved in outer membrane biogenesis
MKALKILLIIVVVLALLAGAGLFLANRYLQSPDFKDTALATARQALGSEVQLADLNVSLFSGVALRGIKVANPTGFDGNLMEAQAFVLRYRLLPLLQKRVEISQLTLDQPTITLVKNEAGAWNYEKLGAAKTGGETVGSGAGPTAHAGGVDISLSRLAMNNGHVVMRQADGKVLVDVSGIRISSSAELTGNRLTGTGEAQIDTLNIAQALFTRSLRTPIVIRPEEVKLAPLTGKLADGELTGGLTLTLSPAFAYGVDLQITGGDVVKLLQEAGAKPALTGHLQGQTKVTGTSGIETITGDGKFAIHNGQLMEIPLLKLLGTLLQVPELQQLKFDECVLEFTIANSQMPTPVIRVTAPKIQLTGSGVVSLTDRSLNHELTLALEQSLLAKVPKEVRGVFADRGDGYLTLTFRVTGPYNDPKTDIQQRLLRGAGEQLLKKGLQQLFK